MLKISPATMTRFLDDSVTREAVSVVAYLRENHAEVVEDLDDDTLRERVVIGLRRARTWGFESEYSLRFFVALMFEISPEFDTHPKIRDRLSEPLLSHDDRLNHLEDVLSEEEWEALAQPRPATQGQR